MAALAPRHEQNLPRCQHARGAVADAFSAASTQRHPLALVGTRRQLGIIVTPLRPPCPAATSRRTGDSVAVAPHLEGRETVRMHAVEPRGLRVRAAISRCVVTLAARRRSHRSQGRRSVHASARARTLSPDRRPARPREAFRAWARRAVLRRPQSIAATTQPQPRALAARVAFHGRRGRQRTGTGAGALLYLVRTASSS